MSLTIKVQYKMHSTKDVSLEDVSLEDVGIEEDEVLKMLD